MSEKKGFLSKLFGGGKKSCCGMTIQEEPVSGKGSAKENCCCNIRIVEEDSGPPGETDDGGQ